MRFWLKRRGLDEQDFEDEIRSHLAMAERDRIDAGADPRTARLASLKDFGNVALTTEAARRVWMPSWLERLAEIGSDVRYALRVLARSPGFAMTVIAVLTLGIGANATVFTMLKSLALAPLSGIADSAQLGIIVNETDKGRLAGLSYRDYQYVRDHDTAFTALAASGLATVNFGRGRGARPMYAELVSGNYFQALGVRAARGRTLLPSDEAAPGRSPYAVLNEGFWRRDFAAAPDIVGKTIEINNVRLTIVGVADPTFHGTIVGYDDEVFIPVTMAPQLGINVGSLQNSSANDILADRGAGVLDVLGRLKPGVSFANARAQILALSTTMSRDAALTDAAQRLKVIRIWDSPYGGQTFLLPALIVMGVMGVLVLAIACANIAGLVLVRGVSRRGELAMRLALGATRSRIVRLLVIENLVLAAPGAILGIVFASRAIPTFTGFAQNLSAPARLFFNIDIDQLVIAFSAVVACGSALVFGFVPALQSSRIDLVSAINEDSSPRGAGRGRFRASLVAVQVAVSLLLLVGAGLTTRSLEAARAANPGFDHDHVSIVALDVRANGYDGARGRVFYRHLLDAMRAEPGVQFATLASTTPLNLVGTREQRVAIDGYTPKRDEDLGLEINTIGPDYFPTLRINLVAGRAFADRDDESAAPVAVVNNTMAQKFWNGAALAIGKRIRVGTGEWRTIVGVAADVKYSQINESPRPFVYLPFFQAYRPSMILHVRSAAPPSVAIEQARGRIEALDPDLPIISAKPLAEGLRGALILLEFLAFTLFVFGACGMALAGLGLYGLVSYSVRQSTHEIGIRMALGATGLSVVREFLARGMKLGVLGAGAGAVAALGVGRLLASVLYGVSSTDLASFTRALVIVLGVVALATIVPAWRASRTNPLTALRHQ